MAKNKIVIANHKMNMLSSDINIYLKKIKEQIRSVTSVPISERKGPSPMFGG